MTLTVVVMTLLIVWAVRNIAADLGVRDVVRDRIKSNGRRDEED